MIVRVTLADLRTGTGTAEIDGIPTPVSAGTARRLAADANLIPIVLGGNSEVLDLGRKQRLFSPAQKHASRRTRRRLRLDRLPAPTRLHPGAPHPLVGPRHRPDRPGQRHPALLPPSSPGARRRLGHPRPRQHALVHPTRTPRPDPHTPPRRTHSASPKAHHHDPTCERIRTNADTNTNTERRVPSAYRGQHHDDRVHPVHPARTSTDVTTAPGRAPLRTPVREGRTRRREHSATARSPTRDCPGGRPVHRSRRESRTARQSRPP